MSFSVSLPWRTALLTLVILSLLSFDVVLLTLLQPLPPFGESTSNVQTLLRVFVEFLAYAGLGLGVLCSSGYLCLRGFQRATGCTRFFRTVLLPASAVDPRLSVLLSSYEYRATCLAKWIPLTILPIIQGFLSLIALRASGSSLWPGLLAVASTHFKFIGLTLCAAILVPSLSLFTLFASTAILYRRNTDEDYRFHLESISRIVLRFVFSVFIYLIFLEICVGVFDSDTTLFNLCSQQIHVLAPFTATLGAGHLFGAFYSLFSERIAKWIESLLPAQEKTFFNAPEPYFVTVLTSSLLSIAMILTGVACSQPQADVGGIGGPKLSGLIPASIAVLVIIMCAITFFLLDMAICFAIIYAKQRQWSHWQLPQDDPEATMGLMEAGALTPQTPQIVLSPPGALPTIVLQRAGVDEEEEVDGRFVLEESDESEDGDAHVDSDDEENEPLLPDA